MSEALEKARIALQAILATAGAEPSARGHADAVHIARAALEAMPPMSGPSFVEMRPYSISERRILAYCWLYGPMVSLLQLELDRQLEPEDHKAVPALVELRLLRAMQSMKSVALTDLGAKILGTWGKPETTLESRSLAERAEKQG